MRFMMLLPASVEALEKCAVPDRGIVTAMRKYDEEMREAGVLLSEEGLHPPRARAFGYPAASAS
jgi:hypothetical protein